jgi:hypothetical protein
MSPLSVSSAQVATGHAALREALTFHAGFDGGTDANYAEGDPRLYSAASAKERQSARAGLPDGDTIRHVAGSGRFGGALRFNARKAPYVFYRGGANMPYERTDWNGTVSFWLNADPEGELAPGFCDPVQITPRAWNDAAFFVEFEKREGSIPFRLGVYADLGVWNPAKRPVAEIPQADRPLITVDKPPFARGRWTHVAFTFEHFNTGRAGGVARLYLDGALQGSLTGRAQTFTWDPPDVAIGLGLNYIGSIDDLAIFKRALTGAEIHTLRQLDGGVLSLHR